MELLQYWTIVRKRLWLIILFVIVAAIGAGYYVLSQPLQYRTSTTLAISPAALNSAVAYQVENQLVPLANTYTEFMKSRSFAQLVAAQLQKQSLPLQPTEEEILGAIITQYVQNTQLFRITTTFRDPVVAKALADTTAHLLINANLERMRAEQAALLEAQLDTSRVQERDRLMELNNVLRDELKFYEDQIEAIQQQIAALRNGPQSSEVDAQVRELRTELLQYRGERVTLLGSLAEAQKALLVETDKSNAQVDTVVVVEEALLPVGPLPRNLLQPFLAAVAAALALGLAAAYGLEYIDYTVKSPEELDAIYGIPTQGVIGHVAEADRAREVGDSLIMLKAPRSPIAESIRALRTSVRMAGIGKPIRSLLITSAGPGEGKTFVTTNLAISIAQAGKQVILVDLDLRKPQVHKRFGVRPEPGFSNLVVERNEYTLQQVLQPTSIPNLRVLACGTIPPNPAELLSAEQSTDVLKLLLENADMVIYDTAPAATVTDAILIAPQVDAVLQVVNARGPRIDLVRRTKELLERSGARVIGPVLNRVAIIDLGYYANYYYYGGYYNSDHANATERKWRWPWQRRRRRHQRHTQPAAPTSANNHSGKRTGEEEARFAINTMTSEEAHNPFHRTRHAPSTNGVQGDYTHHKQ
ncbi:MAG: polysaccharide biosynthesis tyrosine autokinase [Caldilinea sp. CFX5]|nr:polysaccharide biosynthesis tyrosine autokinase [Caldilinea sp. CFX5]